MKVSIDTKNKMFIRRFHCGSTIQELKGGSGLVLFTITIQCETHSVLNIRATSTKDKMADPKQRR